MTTIIELVRQPVFFVRWGKERNVDDGATEQTTKRAKKSTSDFMFTKRRRLSSIHAHVENTCDS